jgi:hypothetical protein
MCPYFSAVIYRTRKLHWSTDTCVLSCSWLHWSMDTFVLTVPDYTKVLIHFSQYNCIRTQCSHDQNKKNVSVLQCSQEQNKKNVSILQCSQEQNKKNLSVYICLVCYWLHWKTDIFVLYVTDYTGVRIHLSCMLPTTLEYEYIYLVCYW